MDQLLPLIEKFKNMTGEAVLNLPKLRFFDSQMTKNKLKPAFGSMSLFLSIIAEHLSNPRNQSYIALSRELCEKLQKLDDLLYRPRRKIASIDEIRQLTLEVTSKAREYQDELEDPSQITFLPKTPLRVFAEAIMWLERTDELTQSLKASYLRRLAMVSMSGGIPVDLLHKQELSEFAFKAEHFPSTDLRFDHADNDGFAGILSEAKTIVERFLLHLDDFMMNEATLRTQLWDPIICLLRALVLTVPNALVSEFLAGKVLDLDGSRIIDLSIFLKGLGVPILLIEAAAKLLNESLRHKDFSKLCCLLTSACARQAEYFQSQGWDPLLARAFGICIGGSGFQFFVARPVADSVHEHYVDCYVSITSKEEWLSDLLQPIGRRKRSRPTPRPSSHGSDAIIEPSESIPLTLRTTVSTDTIRGNIERITLEESVIEEPVESTLALNPSKSALNEYSFKELVLFFKHVDDHLKRIKSFRSRTGSRRPGPPQKPHYFQTQSHVPVSVESSSGITPGGNRASHTQIGTLFQEGMRTPPGQQRRENRPQRALIRKPLNFEYDLYTKFFKLNRIFPVLYSSEIVGGAGDEKGKYVQYAFEYMDALLVDGVYGVPCFGSMVRANGFDSLLVEATTFALHTLFGLHFLHESLEVVHGDISPENIMFSHVDQCWKLNDFGSALRLKDSLVEIRTIGTEQFIAPESIATGIYTKESDIYSLGSVLFRTFHLKLMVYLEMGNAEEEDEEYEFEAYEEDELGYNPRIKSDYVEFVGIVKKMIHEDAQVRPTALAAMNEFMRLFDRINSEKLEPYGSTNIFPMVRALLDSSRCPSQVDDYPTGEVPFQPIM